MGRCSAFWLLIALTGCGHRVDVSFVEPADIALPDEVQQILVVNRSLPGNAGEAVLDATEALATGEGFDADRDTSAAALAELTRVLNETGRFEAEQLTLDPKRVDSGLWAGPLSSRDAQRLCRVHDCDAIIALDALDADTFHTAVDEPREPGEAPQITAISETQVEATFRVYDGSSGAVLDTQRLAVGATDEVTGDAREATAAFAAAPHVQRQLAAEVGSSYGARVAPHHAVASRPLYRTGHPQLRAASKAMRRGDQPRAMHLWRQLVRTGDLKEQAKARHNLAVAQEVRGDLERAWTLASRAAADLSRPRTNRYVTELELRMDQEERLERQLASTDR